MDWYRGLDITEKILSAAAALAVLLGIAIAGWRQFRSRLTPDRIETTKHVVVMVGKHALRPVLIIGAIVWLGIWMQLNLLIQPLHPLPSWTFRQYAFAVALVVPLALLVCILLVEPWHRARRIEKGRDLLMEKQEIPLSLERFKTIDLPSHQPERYYGYSYAPTGWIMVHQTPFLLHPVFKNNELLGHRIINIRPDKNNIATVEDVPANAKDISRVHFLLSAGHGWISHQGVQFLGKRIGYLELVFTDGSKQQVDLILGKHIREWSFGDETEKKVNDVDHNTTKPAWVSYDNTHRIDAMPVSVDGDPKDLVSVRVVAKFEEEEYLEKRPGLTPSIIISAITCETSPSLLHRSQ